MTPEQKAQMIKQLHALQVQTVICPKMSEKKVQIMEQLRMQLFQDLSSAINYVALEYWSELETKTAQINKIATLLKKIEDEVLKKNV